MKKPIDRRAFLQTSAAAGALLAARSSGSGAEPPEFELLETTFDDLAKAMASGKHTSRSIVRAYLERIERVDRSGPSLRAVVETNPDAESIAASLDAERKAGKTRGPLHGVPILIKDNIDTADKMKTTAGSLALVDSKPARDAFVAERLRAAGAVIIGKTNLSEWANFRSTRSVSAWSGRGGQTHNPYALDRNPSGSSSGTGAGVSANLAAAGIGTETDGSVISPSSCCSLVGIKPTIGLVSRAGIIPISHNQDTAGPMARTVRDAAILLSAIAGTDPRDPVTSTRPSDFPADLTAALDANGLRGARVGICRKLLGNNPRVHKLFDEAVEVMRKAGATVVDPADMPSTGKFGDEEFTVLLYDFKADLNAYLAGLGPSAPIKKIEDVIAFNAAHRDAEMPYFDQETMEAAAAKGPLTEKEYVDALAACKRLSRDEGIDAALKEHDLDALVCLPTGVPWLIDYANADYDVGGSTTHAAVAGYPNVTVPLGYVFGLPVGISFFGAAWTEPKLLKIAYAYEQATKARRPPTFAATATFPGPK